MLLTMPAPRSFTGEDCAEVLLPGNPHLLEGVIAGWRRIAGEIGLPLRAAEPGEFTARAFLRGRIDLEQAEGIAATIAATSDLELEAAARLRGGRTAQAGGRAAEELLSLLARLEAGIDFADEEDVVAIEASALEGALAPLSESLRAVAAGKLGVEHRASIPRVALVGPPNAGKSALFNALLDRRRTVESERAGSTRDAVAEPIRLAVASGRGSSEAILVDLAGFDETSDPLGSTAQAVARDEAEMASLRLWCHPADAGPPPPLAAGDLLVFTKIDLSPPPPTDLPAVATSARTGAGLEALREAIAVRLAATPSPVLATIEARHRAALEAAIERIEEARLLLRGTPAGAGPRAPELVAECLRAALESIAAIAGRLEPEEVLGRIFASFCIGK